MKKEDVPQDKSNLESANFRELCYAVDENGEYTTTHSTGWDPKTIALNNAINDIKERVEEARQRVIKGESSPVEYHMERCRMDLQVLASYMEMWQWRVKRHMKPNVFTRLSPKILQRYADTFEISLDQLKEIPS